MAYFYCKENCVRNNGDAVNEHGGNCPACKRPLIPLKTKLIQFDGKSSVLEQWKKEQR